MIGVKLFSTILILFPNFYSVQSCIVTSPTRPVSPTTAAPITSSSVASTASTTSAVSSSTTSPTSSSTTALALRTCSQDNITLRQGDGMNPEVQIAVTSQNFMSTQIGDTQETTSTMQLTCSAIDGMIATMQFNDRTTPIESMGSPQTVTVTLTCNSEDMNWKYVADVNGTPFELTVESAVCRQALRN